MSWGRSRWIAVAAVVAACGGTKDAPGGAESGSGSAAAAGSAAGSNVAEAPLPGASGRTKIQELAKPKVVVMDEPKIDLPSQESFRLLDPGTGAHAVLRYGAATQPWTVTATSELQTRHLTDGTWSAPLAIPKFGIGLTVTPDAKAPNRFGLRILPAQVSTPSPEVDQRLARWRALLAGRVVTAELDDRGQITSLIFNDDPTLARSSEARDALFEALFSGVVPLPIEPVGLHASWRVVTVLRLGPAYGKQTATYTLLERSATRWKIHVKQQRVAEEQRINDPKIPAGVTMDLVALFRSVETDVEIDPARRVSGGGAGSSEQRMHIRFTKGTTNKSEQMFEDTGALSSTLAP